MSNLRKATSEPNIQSKARHPRQKLPAFNRSATFSTPYSPRKEIHPALRNRAPSMTDDANHNVRTLHVLDIPSHFMTAYDI